MTLKLFCDHCQELIPHESRYLSIMLELKDGSARHNDVHIAHGKELHEEFLRMVLSGSARGLAITFRSA